MSVRTRPASADDFRNLFGRDPPPVWLGLAAVDESGGPGGEIVGLGIVFWDEWGRAWGSYSAKRALPPVTMHRAARRVLAALEGAGEPALHVFCSRAIAGSEAWLRHLGFRPAPELDVDPDFPVWMKPWQISG
jgi:hypothetical protein